MSDPRSKVLLFRVMNLASNRKPGKAIKDEGPLD
jgi:hypothetical protein